MEMCRVCLYNGTGFVPMDENFIAEYNMLTNLNITMEDMPLYTCIKCFEGAKFCVKFREKCIESDQTLKKILFPDTNGVIKENDEKLMIVKNEIKMEVNDDIEFLESCYNYGEEYVEPSTESTSIDECIHEEYEETRISASTNKCYTGEDDIQPTIKARVKKPQKDRLCKRKYVRKEIVVDAKLLCGICPKELKDKEELTSHLDQHKTDFACEVCNESLISVPHMLGHRIEHVPKEQKICHICGRKFISIENLEFHYMRVHEMAEKDALIQCKKCIKSFTSVKQLQKHNRTHTGLKYSCDHCSKSFRFLNVLRVHMGKHTTKPAYKCNLCDYTSKYSNGIYTHKLRKHTAGNAVCKTCGRVFASQEKLDKHDCRHRLPVVCPVCGITFQAKGKHSFAEHLRGHSATPLYRCTQCPAAFRTRKNLSTHLDQHAGTPRHRCDVCERTFYSQSVLIRHRRVHTGEKPYVCEICNRGFGGNHNLKVHMKVHGIVNLIKKKDPVHEEKTYVCEICNRGFGGSHNLKIHMMVHLNVSRKKDPIHEKK